MSKEAREAALHVVDRMVAAYSAHDVQVLRGCFAEGAKLRDDAWNESHEGTNAIATHYRREFESSPDVEAWVVARYASVDGFGDAGLEPFLIELMVRGSHLGAWRGLPATGARFEIRVFNTIRFTRSGERILEVRFTYDRASILHQLGVMHDPTTTLGRTLTALTHPVTMAKVAQRRLSARPPSRA